MSFFENLDPSEKVLICKHCVADPTRLVFVYHSETGKLSTCCEADHEMSPVDWTWAHASHFLEKHPQLKTLEDVPPNHVAEYFADHDGQWAVATLLDPDEDET